MSGTGKAKDKAERIKGKTKETAGKAVGNERLESEGKTDQAKGGLREAGEKVKDAAAKAKRAVKDVTKD